MKPRRSSVLCFLVAAALMLLPVPQFSVAQDAPDDLLQQALKVMPPDEAKQVSALRPEIAREVIDAWTRQLQVPFARQLAAMQKPDFAFGDKMRLPLSSPIARLSPHVSRSMNEADIQGFVLDSLAERDPDDPSRWVPMLAKRYLVRTATIRTITVRDPATGESTARLLEPGEEAPAGADVTTAKVPQVIWVLREGLRFSDGHALTAKDVAFSWQFVMNPLLPAEHVRSWYGRIARVEALDELTVVFTFGSPWFDVMSLSGTMPILPEHIYAPYLSSQEQAEELLYTDVLVGSGPYQLSEDVGTNRVRLERNPQYWGVRPPLDELVWHYVGHPAGVRELLDGTVDFVGIRPAEWTDACEQTADKASAFEYLSPTAGYTYIAWNQRDASRADAPSRFADVRVRRALTMLINKPQLARDVFLDKAFPAKSPFHPKGTQADPEVADLPFDVDEARKLLKAAGFEDRDGDGVIESADGKPFSFSLTYPAGSADYQKLVASLCDAMQAAGVQMKPRPMEFAVMVEALDSREFEAISLGWTSGFEIDIYQMFHSEMRGGAGDNFMSYSNPQLDELLTKARSETDPDVRCKLWRRCDRILVDDQPYTFLFRRKSLVLVNNRFANVRVLAPGHLDLGRSRAMLDIYVPAERQK